MRTAEVRQEEKGGTSHCQPVWLVGVMLLVVVLSACGPSSAELAAVDYTPITTEIWPVSSPEEQGLDPDLVAGPDGLAHPSDKAG
jgi:hypothetical protein